MKKFESTNDFLYTIRPIVKVLKFYGIYLADAETLNRRKLSIWKRILQSILPCLYLLFISSWIFGLIQSLTKNTVDKVELCFYIVMIVMSLASVNALAILLLKRNSIELMVADIQMAFKRLDNFKFTISSRRAAVLYALFPFVGMVVFIGYLIGQILTDFNNEKVLQTILLEISDDGITCNASINMNDEEIFNQCKKSRTISAALMTLVWIAGSLFSVTHTIGFVIIIIFCIKMYFNYYSEFPSESGDGHLGSIESPWFVKSKGKFSEENIRNSIELHRAGCQMVKLANGALKELCFAMSAAEVLIIIFSFRGMNLKSPAEGLGMKVLLSNVISYFTFITRAVVASRVNKSVMSSLKVMLKIEPNWGSECPSPKVAKWIKSYVKHVRLDPPSFTGWGLYRITEGCILTVSGHILTYTLTLYGIGG